MREGGAQPTPCFRQRHVYISARQCLSVRSKGLSGARLISALLLSQPICSQGPERDRAPPSAGHSPCRLPATAPAHPSMHHLLAEDARNITAALNSANSPFEPPLPCRPHAPPHRRAQRWTPALIRRRSRRCSNSTACLPSRASCWTSPKSSWKLMMTMHTLRSR